MPTVNLDRDDGSLVTRMNQGTQTNLNWVQDLYGTGNSQGHHLIPVNGLPDNFIARIGEIATEANIAFDINDASNGVYLPTENSVGQVNGRFAAQHRGPHNGYSDFVSDSLEKIIQEYDDSIAEIGKPAAAAKVFSDVDNLKAFLADGLITDNPRKLLFILNNNDTLLQQQIDGTRYSNIDAEEFTRTQTADIVNKLDYTNKPIITVPDNAPYRLEITQIDGPKVTVENFKLGLTARFLTKIQDVNVPDGAGGTSVLILAATLGLMIPSTAKAAQDAGYDTSFSGIQDWVENSNLASLFENFDFSGIAQSLAIEAAVEVVARLIGGPISIAYNIYDIVQNWSALRGAVDFSAEIYGTDSVIGQIDGTLDRLEARFSSWFGNEFEARPREELTLDEIQRIELIDELVADGRIDLIPSDDLQEILSLQGINPTTPFDQLSASQRSEAVLAYFNTRDEDDISADARDLIEATLAENCFVAGTQIEMFDGTSKPIEDIQIGDSVASFDEAGARVPGYVDKLFSNVTDALIRLEMAGGESLIVTPGHRFMTASGDYLELEKILRLHGDSAVLVNAQGDLVSATAERLEFTTQTAHLFETAERGAIVVDGNTLTKPATELGWKTYNFEVAQVHNYVAGSIRVHNDSILTQLAFGDELLSVNADLTTAAILRDMNDDGVADFVILDGYRDPLSGSFNTQVQRVLTKVWNPADGDLSTLFADEFGASYVDAQAVRDNVFDPGNGSNWGDFGANGLPVDDIEEMFWDDIANSSLSGTDRAEIDALYSVTPILNGTVVTPPNLDNITDEVSLLLEFAALTDAFNALGPVPVTYNLSNGDAVEPPFQPSSSAATIAFLLGADLSYELVEAQTIDGPFGPIEVLPAVTLGSFLATAVDDQSQFDVVFGNGITPADVSQAQDGDNLVLTIDTGNGAPGTLTLEGVYADGNTDELASVVYADGTTQVLSDIPVTLTGDGIVSGTDANDTIDAAYTDVDGDVVSDGDDSLVAGLGDDTMAAGAGNDIYNGGDGTDTVLLDGANTAFVYAHDGTALTVTDSDPATGVDEGTDTLIDVENLTFSNGFTATIAVSDRTTINTQSDAGLLVSQMVLDSSGTFAWSDYTTTYGPDGTTRTDTIVNYDDGRIADRDYDAAGVRTSQTVTDVENAYAWSDYTTTYGPDGTTRTDTVVNYDDGRVQDRDYDAAGVRTTQTLTDVENAYAWSDYTTTYGPDGTTRTDTIVNYDDGRVQDRDYDAAGVRTSQTVTDVENAYAWSDYTTTYGPDGTTRTDTIVIYDDGRVQDRDYDAAGVRTSQTVTDVEDAFAFTDYTTTFAADGTTRTDVIINYDDGRVLDRDFDAEGLRTSQTMTDVEDAYSWASYTQTFDAQGNLIETVYVDDTPIG
ncbi:AHH domain-containing protein [Algirhabdus cladophorae]|uniref:AHH domain-containing protein n=1 Tax=Algirhabdus cladophorae TaxID=3377108 RepID=UPI003B846D9D